MLLSSAVSEQQRQAALKAAKSFCYHVRSPEDLSGTRSTRGDLALPDSVPQTEIIVLKYT